VALGLLISALLRTQKPVGQYVGALPTVRAVQSDSSSPVEENPAANVTIVVFTDYRCPACRRAHPDLKGAALKDGRVRIIYKDWPIFGPPSERAARIAIASDHQGLYPRLHDRLMRATRFDEAGLAQEVARAGGDWQRLLHDLDQHAASIEAQLANNGRQAFALGLPGTPGYLVGPVLVRGAATEAEFRKAIAEARRKS
jgi:protein-disulfide isomerase